MSRRRPLRLLMTADAVGGVWQYATDLASALSARDVEVTLAVLGPAPSAQALADALAMQRTHVVITGEPLDWMAASQTEVTRAARAVAALAYQMRADVVHLNSPALAAQARFPAPVVGVCHSCIATWWQAVRTGPLPSDFAWRTQLLAQGYRAVDALVAPTAAFARMTAAAYGIPAPVVVRNGRRVGSQPPRGGLASFVFTAGRLWDDGKNIATLDRAAARLGGAVRAAGSLTGPNGVALVLSHIEHLGQLDREDISDLLSQTPVFASVPRYEPFGLAVLEAAQAGCALVLSDIPTLRELWDGAALFVAGDDDTAIAEAIRGLFADPAQRMRLGAAAQTRSRAYTVENAASDMLAIYHALLARAAARPPEAAA